MLSLPSFRIGAAAACLLVLAPAAAWPQFSDQTEVAGVGLFHISGPKKKSHIVETMSGGAAFFDYDNDGNLDLYAVNGSTVETYKDRSGPGNALYRNRGDATFRDVASQAGAADGGWGHGCTVGDIDGDGYRDLYVTNYGPNVLYRNKAGTAFEDISISAGVAGNAYSISAAFFDYDNDGDLDLYSTTYLVYDTDSPPDRECNHGGYPVYCGPQGLARDADVFYRNDGGGAFTDVTRPSGVSWANRYYGLGLLPADFDADGYTDLFVANDKTPNLIFHNNGDGTFTEMGMEAGVAYNADGDREAGMGVAGGDIDGDGDLDLYVTHFFRESNTLYLNDGQGRFEDLTQSAGLEDATLGSLGWGTHFFDQDNDGDLDLFVANGHVYPGIDLARMGTSYEQRNQFFRSQSPGHLVEVTSEAGPGLMVEKASRGAAFGDYDNDGDTDVYVMNLNDTATLLRNDREGGNWLVVQLFGSGANRDGVGATIRVTAGDRQQWRYISGASSYLSFNDLRAHFGLGDLGQADLVEIRWPDGTRQEVRSVPANRLLAVRQGGGSAVLERGVSPYE